MCRVQSSRLGRRIPLALVFSAIGVAALGFAFATLVRSRTPFAIGVHAVGVERPVDVVLGEVRTIQCQLFNNLERTIEIDSVSTGCACRTASVRPRLLSPGARAEVEIVYDASHSADHDLTFPIVVTCVDGERITAEGQITIRHDHAIAFDDAFIDFGEIPVQSAAVRTVLVTAASGSFREIRASAAIEGLAVAVQEDGGTYGTIACRLGPVAGIGDVSGNVRVEVCGFRGRDVIFQLPVRGTIIGPVAIHPPAGLVGMMAPGRTKTIRFDIKSRAESKPIVIDAVIGPDWANVKHVCYAAAEGVVLDVAFCPEDVPSDLRQFDLGVSGSVDGIAFEAIVRCVAVAIAAEK